jgi:hypothetical protein
VADQRFVQDAQGLTASINCREAFTTNASAPGVHRSAGDSAMRSLTALALLVILAPVTRYPGRGDRAGRAADRPGSSGSSGRCPVLLASRLTLPRAMARASRARP